MMSPWTKGVTIVWQEVCMQYLGGKINKNIELINFECQGKYSQECLSGFKLKLRHNSLVKLKMGKHAYFREN